MSTAVVERERQKESEGEGLPQPRRTWVMLAVVCGVSLMSLDSAIANIALPTIARDLSASESTTVWVVNAYQLGSVLCLLPAAALGEILGLKKVYAAGLVLFSLSSLACALAPSLGLLIAARLAQGVGCACIAAIGPAVIRDIYPRRLIGVGISMVALSVAVGGAAGPTIASLILSVAHWPWLFLVNIPVGMIAVPLFVTLARPGKPQPQPRPFDVVATVLSAAALGPLLIGVDSLGSGDHTLALAEIAFGLACGALLVWHQLGRKNALLPLDLLKIPLLSLSVVTSICSYSAQILAYVSLPFLFETVMHRSQVATGLLVTPWPLMIVLAAPIAGRLSAHYPAAILSSIGLAVMAIGLGLLAAMPDQPADWNIAWRMALCGVGFGFFQTPNNATILTGGPPSRSGAAGGILAVARTLGWCIGSALVTLIFALSPTGATMQCLLVACGFATVGAIVSVSRGAVRRR